MYFSPRTIFPPVSSVCLLSKIHKHGVMQASMLKPSSSFAVGVVGSTISTEVFLSVGLGLRVWDQISPSFSVQQGSHWCRDPSSQDEVRASTDWSHAK